MMFFWTTIKLIIGVGGGLWLGHWSRRRFGRWGIVIASVAFVAALFVVSWAKHLVGSNERIMSRDGDAVAYSVETPRLPENLVSPFREIRLHSDSSEAQCISITLGPDGLPVTIAVPCAKTTGK